MKATFLNLSARVVSLFSLAAFLTAFVYSAQAQRGGIVAKGGNEPIKADSVHSAIFDQMPALPEFAQRARDLGNIVYPKILSLLHDEISIAPRQFDIVFKKHLEAREIARPAYTKGTTIYVASDWFIQDSQGRISYLTNATSLETLLVHEMAHVAQGYRQQRRTSYWTEGIADYVAFKLGFTNAWGGPQCSGDCPHYTYGYGCSGAFLLYLDRAHDSHFVKRLNTELRRNSYSDEFFLAATGRSLDQLWTDFQRTDGFTVDAAPVYDLEKSLGYTNGKPPEDIGARAHAYLKMRPGGAFSINAGQFLSTLLIQGQLPPWQYGPKGSNPERPFTLGIEPSDLLKESNSVTYPVTRTFYGQAQGDSFKYHYVAVRNSKEADWKLLKAWQTTFDGRVVRDFHLP